MAQQGGAERVTEAPWTDVVRTALDELRSFIQQEIRLATAEIGGKVRQAGMGAGMVGAAGFLGFLAAGALTAAMILGLSLLITPWLAALAVALFYGVLGGLLALTGKKKVQEATPFVPARAVETMQGTKDRLQQAWERGNKEGATPSTPGAQRNGGSYGHLRRGGSHGSLPRY